MLPFARMLQYGNAIPRVKIKDVITSYGNVFVLYTDGLLIGTGDNTLGEMGMGNRNSYRGVWATFPIQNIKHVTCSINSTVVINTNNRVYMTGDKVILGTPTIQIDVPEDITSLFSTFNLDEDEVLCGSRGIMVLRANGDLYSIGEGTSSSGNLYGNVGLGTTRSLVFKKVGSSVAKIFTTTVGSSECSFYITSTGDLYSTGRNLYGACGLGYVGETPTFTKVSTVFDSAIKHVFASYSSSTVITVNGTMYSSGQRSLGQFGDGITTPTNTPSFTKNNVLTITDSVQSVKSFPTSDSLFIPCSDKFYSAGQNYYGSFSNGTKNPSTTFINTYTLNGNNFRPGGYYNYYFDENTVYACGRYYWIPGATNDVLTFAPVPTQPRLI